MAPGCPQARYFIIVIEPWVLNGAEYVVSEVQDDIYH